MVSHSRDGSLQSGILSRLGLTVVRGSSSRGGAQGLRGVVRCLRIGSDGAFAVDGPRGPSGVIKDGVLTAARLSGAVVVPVTFSASPAWVFRRSWDGYTLPLPFARVAIVAGEPFQVPRTSDPALLDHLRASLKDTLHALAASADEGVDRIQ